MISIITPNYNYGRYLKDCIESIQAQEGVGWELFICDDGSTDNSEEVVRPFLRDPRIHWIAGQHTGGPAAARNRGIKASTGVLVAFLDADDMLTPGSLRWRSQALLQDGVDFLCAQAVDVEDDVTYDWATQLPLQPTKFSCYRMPTVMMKRQLLEQGGLFDERLLRHEETELFIRMFDAPGHTGKKSCRPEVAAFYRVHPGSIIDGLKTMDEAVRKQHADTLRDVVTAYHPKFRLGRHRKRSLNGMNIFHANKLQGWMSTNELRFLAAMAGRFEVIVEAGSYKGRSTRAMADNAIGRIYCADPWGIPCYDDQGGVMFETDSFTMRKFEKNLRGHIVIGRVTPVRCKFTDLHLPEQVDAVFIDADHRYESVRGDVKHALEMKPKFIAGHDYGAKNCGGVKMAVDELIGPVGLMDSIWWKDLR